MKSNKKFLVISFSIILAILLTVIIGGYLEYLFFNGDWGQSGSFGDSFGAINATFTGLAFGGVIITLLIQIKASKENQKVHSENVRIALLTAKINASISKQEIFAQFLVAGKIYPDRDNYDFGQLRVELKSLMNATDELINSADNSGKL